MEAIQQALSIKATKVIDPLNFSAQIGSERAFEAFAIYEKGLSIVCDQEAVPVTFSDINVGYFGYIRLDNNYTWRRVEVVDINRENAEVDVLHIDYLIEDSLAAARLMSCASVNLPPVPVPSMLVCKCSLADVRPIASSKKWVSRAVSLVSSFILDKKCYVELVGYSSMMTLLVNITVEVDGERKLLSNLLIDNDLALKEDENVCIVPGITTPGVPLVPVIASFPVMIEPEPVSPELLTAVSDFSSGAVNEERALVEQMQNLNARILTGNVEGLNPNPYNDVYEQIDRIPQISSSSQSIGKKSNGQRRPVTQRNRGAGNARGHVENMAHQRSGSTAAETGDHAGRGSNSKSQEATINHSNKERGRKSRENSESDVSVASVNRGQQHGHHHGDSKADLRGHPKTSQHVNAFKEVGPNLGTNNGEPVRDRTDKAGVSRSSAKAAKSSKRQQNDNARNATAYERNNNDVADEKARPKQIILSERFNEIYGIIEQAFGQGSDTALATVILLCTSDNGDDVVSVVTTALLRLYVTHAEYQTDVLALLTRLLDLPNADKALCDGIQQTYQSLCENPVVDKSQSSSFIQLLSSLYLSCDKVNIVQNFILNLVEVSPRFDKKKSSSAVEVDTLLLKQFLCACGAKLHESRPAVLQRIVKEVKRSFCMTDVTRIVSDVLFDVLAMDRGGWVTKQHIGDGDTTVPQLKRATCDADVQATVQLSDVSTQTQLPLTSTASVQHHQNFLVEDNITVQTSDDLVSLADSHIQSQSLRTIANFDQVAEDVVSYIANDFASPEMLLRGAASNDGHAVDTTSYAVDATLSSSSLLSSPRSPSAVNKSPLAQHLAYRAESPHVPHNDGSRWSPNRPAAVTTNCSDSPHTAHNDGQLSAARQLAWDGAVQVCTNCGSSEHRLYDCTQKKQLFHE